MKFEEIEKLMESMKRFGLTKLSIKQGDFEVSLERETALKPAPQREHIDTHMTIAPQPLVRGHHTGGHVESHDKHAHSAHPPAADNHKYVTSPMVGTFYTASSPDDTAFIKVGDTITPDSVVCIIEAMKVMNEIKSEVAGVVTEILVQDIKPVEFGQKLFCVRPA